MAGFFGRVARSVADALFPRFCARCEQEGTSWCSFCDAAYVLHPPAPGCAFCGRGKGNWTCASCAKQVYTDRVHALSSYADAPLKTLIRQWKYHGERESEEVLRRFVRRAALYVPEDMAVSYVPLHIGRRRGRGFDQAEEIARTLASALDRPLARTLVREKKAPPMARRERRLVGDMDGAYRSVPPAPERVLLCDDVFTSGATLDAAAKCLKAAGCKEVWGFVVAKG